MRSLSLGLPLLASGCGLFSQLQVEPLATAADKPSNVAAYVSVSDAGEPVDELTASNFRVYENEQLLSPEQTDLRLVDRNLVAAHHALLLLDMSTAGSAARRAETSEAALQLLQKLDSGFSTSVYAFDGRADLVLIAEGARGSAPKALPALERFVPRDSSRNLHGALQSALEKLDATLARSGKPIRLGTLFVFAGGPDLAGRVSEHELREQLEASGHDLFALVIGQESQALAAFDARATVRVQSLDTLGIAFTQAGMQAQSELERHYLVSYCSPARAGTRRLRLEVSYTTKDGSEHAGDFETEFDASGFGPGCRSESPPRFVYEPRKLEPRKSAPQSPSRAQDAPNAPAPSSPTPEPDDAPVAPPERPDYAK
jgi:hypothetical protein